MLLISKDSLVAAALCLPFLMMLIPASSDALMEFRWQGLFSLRHCQTSDSMVAVRKTAGSLESCSMFKFRSVI